MKMVSNQRVQGVHPMCKQAKLFSAVKARTGSKDVKQQHNFQRSAPEKHLPKYVFETAPGHP